MSLRSGRASEFFAIAVFAAVIGSATLVLAHRESQARESAHRELLRQESLARSEGIPLTPGEILKAPAVPDDENAVVLYHQANQQLTELAKKTPLPAGFPTWKFDAPENIRTERMFLEQAKPAMDLAATAAKKPTCDMHLKLTQTDIYFPKLAEFKFIAKVAVAQAELEAHDGKPIQALETLQAYAPICGQLSQTHTMMSGLTQVATDTIFARSITDILDRFGMQPGVGQAAVKVLEALGPLPNLVSMAETEYIIGLGDLSPKFVEDAAKTATNPKIDKDIRHIAQLALRPGMLDRWRTLEVEMDRKVVALFRSAGDNWLEIENKAKQLDDAHGNPKDDAHFWGGFASANWDDAIDAVAKALSRRRVLAQAATILDFASRNARPNFADRLPLDGIAARDPLSKGNLHYTRTANGFTIYGVGANGVDHGGVQVIGGSYTGNSDIVFAYPAPASQTTGHSATRN